ncbi:uncharacterized protein LOC121574647 isoform X2 [Coregonus clupeaformis]|uniref:uncharacterized protein LOC121574647 isoform X2 n=1 Tax=Coregonus clupeaformis TaxID=59861 RepID=UPI001E1C47EE|nr:uncharacterized protein LOC121574647 isoform X2 [Coregonus clupeaformis]
MSIYSPYSDTVSVTLLDLPQPRLTVSSTVIRERDSVQLSCEAPPYVSVSQCYFYTEGRHPKPSPCTRSLTGTELLSWAGQSSSAEVKLRCFYTVETRYPSTHTDPAPITILGELQKPDISVNDESSHDITIACVLPESVSDGSSCNLYTGDQPQAYKEAWVRRFNAASSKLFCTFSVTKNDLFRHLQLKRDVRCDYRVNTGLHSLSPRSDEYIITGQKPNITVSLKENLIITCLIPGSVSPDTPCNLYVGEQSQYFIRAPIRKKKHTDSKGWFCQFFVAESDLIRRLQSVRRKEVSCDYRVSSEPNSLSPRSDGYRFTVGLTPGPRSTLPASTTVSPTEDTTVRPTTSLTSPLTPSTAVNPTSGGQSSTESVLGSTVTSTLTPDITVRPTSLTSPFAPSTAVNLISDLTVSPTLTSDTPKSPTERGQSSTDSVVNSNGQKRVLAVQLWQAAVGMASGVGMFLMGMTAVCLCRRNKKNYSQRPTAIQDDHSRLSVLDDLVMGAVSSAGMLDSRDAGINSLITFVPSTFLPSGPVQVSANEDVDSENVRIYSLITSVPSTSIPSGPFEENGQSSENDNSDVYHVYSSIPDRPATSAQPDGLYSLLQAH